MASKRILIIDDDIELCEEIKESLQSEEYIAEVIQDAIKGESLIRGSTYDIILLDYKMPNQSGIDILKKLKADGIKKRIFIFSGRPSVEKALKDADLLDMISGIINKPVSFEALLDKISSADRAIPLNVQQTKEDIK